ncbi:MAG: hypothetical protein WA970_04635 [Gammaproteobacteria bacterium]
MFKTFVDKLLVPVLQPGDRVLLDNSNNFHKGQGIEEAIRTTGATLYSICQRTHPTYRPLKRTGRR